MKIPAYIDEALRRRTKSAQMWKNNDIIISDFVRKNSIDDEIDDADIDSGVESICNPEESEKRIRIAIARKRTK